MVAANGVSVNRLARETVRPGERRTVVALNRLVNVAEQADDFAEYRDVLQAERFHG